MARKKKKRYASMKDRARQNAKENREARSAGGTKFRLPSDVEEFEETPGRVTLRIVPYEVTSTCHPDSPAKPGELWYKRPYQVHGSVGVSNAPYICLKSFRKPCPICDELSRLRKDRDADKDILNDLKPRHRVLYNVMVVSRSRKYDEDTIYLWDISYYNFQNLLEEEIEEGEEEWAGFADLEDGYNLKVRFSEKSFAGNKFAQAARIDFVAADDLDEGILEDAINLDEILLELPYEKLEAIFLEVDSIDDDDFEEEKIKTARKQVLRK